MPKRGLTFYALAMLTAANLTSCKNMSLDHFDRWSFSLTGGTVFSEPFQVTTKQLHFDTGDLFGKDVVLVGDIQTKGEAGTHIVLSDNEGRMLVVLTQVDDSYQLLESSQTMKLRVLGRLERGKKGLPYLLAKAIKSDSQQAQ